MDRCNFEKCKWLHLLFFKKNEDAPRNSDSNAATPCTFVVDELNQNAINEIYKEVPTKTDFLKKISLKSRAKPTFRTFVN